MPMGAFFAIVRGQARFVVAGAVLRDPGGRSCSAPPCLLLDPSARGPDRRRDRDQHPRPRRHRLPVHRHLRDGGRRPTSPRSRTSISRSSRTPLIGDVFGQLNLMIWIAILLVFLTWVVVFRTPVGADPLGRRAPARPTRSGSTSTASATGPSCCPGCSRLQERLHLDRVHPLLQRGHDRWARVHRPGRADLRQLAPLRCCGGMSPLRLLHRARPAARHDRGVESYAVLFQALPYVLTLIAVAGVIGRSIPPAAVGRPYKKQ